MRDVDAVTTAVSALLDALKIPQEDMRQAAQYGARYRGPLLTRSMVMFCLKEAKQCIKRMEKDPQVFNPRIVETMHGKPIKATWSPL